MKGFHKGFNNRHNAFHNLLSIDNSMAFWYRSNKIRKTQNEHLNIVCEQSVILNLIPTA